MALTKSTLTTVTGDKVVTFKNESNEHYQGTHLDDDQLTTLTPPALTTLESLAGDIKTAAEAIQAAVGLLAKLTDTQPVSLATVPSHAVTDGGGSLTVDGSVTADTGLTQPLTDTELRASEVPVSLAAFPTDGAVVIKGNDITKAMGYYPIATDLSGRIFLAPNGDPVNVGFSADETILSKCVIDSQTVTPTLDTSAYADGDVLFTASAVSKVGSYLIKSLTVIDRSDQGGAFDVYFFDQTVTIGTRNNTPSISDDDAFYCIGKVSIASSDYADLGGVQIAYKSLDIPVPAAKTPYVCGISKDTKTYASNGLSLVFGMQL